MIHLEPAYPLDQDQQPTMPTPSATAMNILITQVQEDMDSFNENGKDINYYRTMLGYMKDSKAHDMWGYYLMGHIRNYGVMPDCWVRFKWKKQADGQVQPRVPFSPRVWDTYAMDNCFPEEWCDAWEDESILPDDPKDMSY